MSRRSRRDRIDKLRRLSQSPNPHEAALAREEAARLSALEPPAPPVTAGGRDPAYPDQLPGCFRVRPLGAGR